jgi:predicted molibdopterin-dependent oxidoreductase YjgC
MQEILDCVSQIELLDGVINASLVYQHVENWQSLNQEVTHDCTRRDFVRQSAAAAAGAVAGIPIEVLSQDAGAMAADLKWSKAPCRFCGTGCGVMVAVKDNRVVATQGDPEAEVNRG